MHKWLIFGDSHVSAFQYAHDNGEITAPCEFLSVNGATAVGLRNPNSLTNALATFRSAMIPVRQNVVPVMQLGEVDCGFVIWWRSEKYGETIEAQVEASIDAYFEFVDLLINSGYPRVVITGATMPTILDGQDWGEVANARRDIRAKLADRIALTRQYNALTRQYNARLDERAERRKLPFIDISQQVIDPESGYVADGFRHPNPADHHLNPETAGRLWAAALNAIDVPAPRHPARFLSLRRLFA